MMKSNYLWMVALAAALTGCAKDSDLADNPVNPASPTKNNTETVAKQPVLFGAYVNRATTRAGDPGVLVTSGATAGQINLQEKGFGVIAYYTDDDMYSPIYQPNFMYNTKVTHNGSAWAYEPVQYWPNETGENAVSEGVDRLSFFAYAPYVDVTPSTGVVTGDDASGIVGLSRNGAFGDPWVKYYVSLDPAKQVDFSWAVPQINMVKPNVTDVVNMQFNHALAALNVQVDAMIDELAPGNNTLDDNTKIYIRSVSFEGLVTKGSFNLNSTKATWYDLAGANYIDGGSVTVYDGRTNGKEGQSESANESPLGLNPVLVQSQPYSGTPTAGVTNAAANLFAGTTADAPIYVIPSGQPLTVTIVYDVETATDELAGYLSDGETHGTSVENKITKSISFGTSNKLEAGKLYKLTLHLGMTSVKFDATVAEWDESTDSSSADLPQNIVSIGSVELTSNGNPLTNVTVWKNETSVAAPDVTVVGSDGSPLSGVTLNWSSDNASVATVDDDGAVSLAGVSGTSKITVTATKEGVDGSATASYDVYVNEITGISVTPATSNVGVGGKTTLTATLTHTNLGTIGALPAISWVSGSTDKVTISATTDNSTQATGVAEGSSTITASVDEAYMKDGVSNAASGVVNCRSAINMAYRGYEVSTGILEKTIVGDNASFSLTSGAMVKNVDTATGEAFYALPTGCNPFELQANYYGQSSSISKYYFQWINDLRSVLGADGSNIDADSQLLPEGWRIPTGNDATNNNQTEWHSILFGSPKTAITVNGNSVTSNAFAQVSVVLDNQNSFGVAAGTYLGLLLLRDGTTIPSGYLNKVGTGSKYSDNVLNEEKFKELVRLGCLYLSVTGTYYEFTGRPVTKAWKELNSTYQYGTYWTSNIRTENHTGYYLLIDQSGSVKVTSETYGYRRWRPVRLIKEASDE